MSEADVQKVQAIRYWFGMAHACLNSFQGGIYVCRRLRHVVSTLGSV